MTRGTLRRLVFLAWDGITGSMVIGPMTFKEGDAPSLLEFGGSGFAPPRRDERGLPRRSRRRSQATHEARPFMGPAVEAERPKLPQVWRDSVGGST